MSPAKAPFATLIKGGTLILPDESGRVRAEAGDLLMQDGRIAALGDVGKPPSDARVIYASGCAVLPGFVQTHVHLCQTLFRGLADELTLLRWLRERIWPLEAAHTPESIRASARLAVAELLLGGTTAVQTMESVHHTDAVIEVLVDSGIFAVTGKALMDDPETCPRGLLEPTEWALREAVDLIETWDRSNDGRVRVCLAPRFAVSCTDACLREVVALAELGKWRIHTHASENLDEIKLVVERTGKPNIRYLHDTGIAGEHVGLAHAVWVDESDIAMLAESGTNVLHCPGSNCKLGSGVAPVPRMLDAGVHVSLGADGAACNNTLDMFREMRLATLLQEAVVGPESMPASVVLDMATRRGARALGWEGEMGALVPGSWANVTLVSLENVHTTPGSDPVATLVYCSRSSDIRAVWLAGEQVVSEGRLTLWDEDKLRRDAELETRGLLERAGLS